MASNLDYSRYVAELIADQGGLVAVEKALQDVDVRFGYSEACQAHLKAIQTRMTLEATYKRIVKAKFHKPNP